VLYTDSNLIVQQMSGKWQVKNEKLKPLYKEAMKYLLELGVSWTFGG
jgi:ribonuclease HI